jgi:hypothetical protein
VALVELHELIALLRGVGVHVVEDVERVLAMPARDRTAVATMLLLALHREDGRGLTLGASLALGKRGVGLRVENVVGEQASLLNLSALVCQLEDLNNGGEGVVDAQLLTHLDISDARREGRDDLGIGDARDLVAYLAEALDELAQHLARMLAHGTKVISGVGMLVRPCEVGDEPLAHLTP